MNNKIGFCGFFVFAVLASACTSPGSGSDATPATYGEACHEMGTVFCALTEKREACDGTPVDATDACVDVVASSCCGVDGKPACEAPAPEGRPFKPFSQYDACVEAIDSVTCEGLDQPGPDVCHDLVP